MTIDQLGGLQAPLPGLEDYVCTFKCLTHCPLPPGRDCIWDDPGAPFNGFDDDFDALFEAEFPDFSWWREFNEELVRREPKDPTQTRCRRCWSIKVDVGYPYIQCRNCGYNEPLVDYPENVGVR